MRIGGLASGMDTEQMVRDLMRAERMRLDKFFQNEQRLLWKQETFASMNRNMARFILDTRRSFGITDITDNGYFRASAVNGFDWVKKATSSNESIVRASASANAIPGNHRVEVQQLAEVASVISQKLTGENGVVDSNLRFEEKGSFTVKTAAGEKEMKIGSVGVIGGEITNFNFSGDNSLTFSLNGIPIRLDEDYENMEGIINEINRQLGEIGDITVEADENKLKLTSDSAIHIAASAEGNLSAIGLAETSEVAIRSINDMVRELNNDTSLGIRAAFDVNIGKLMITSRNTGEEEFIQIVDAGQGLALAEKMFGGPDAKIFQEAYDANGKPRYDPEGEPIGVVGQNAEILFNGNEVSNANNNFSVFGVNLQLQLAEVGEEITINIAADTEGIFNKIKEFVDQYNTLLDEINGQLKQKHYRDFPPLTDEQKEAMSEKDIEKWEEKAKSGLLRNDSTLTRTLQSVRNGLYEKVTNVTGSYSHLTQLGIATGAYQDGGKLVINEERLRNAINQDPEGVVNLMFKLPDSSLEGDERKKDTGLVQRIYNDLMIGMEEIVRQSGYGEDSALLTSVKGRILREFRTTHSSRSVLDRDLSNINSRIAREEAILVRREERYWQQFTAMEKALSKMYQQSDWLMAQMGQMY